MTCLIAFERVAIDWGSGYVKSVRAGDTESEGDLPDVRNGRWDRSPSELLKSCNLQCARRWGRRCRLPARAELGPLLE